MMCHGKKGVQIGDSRCVNSQGMPQVGEYRRLIQYDPVFNPVAEMFCGLAGVIGKPPRNIPTLKSSAILKRLWKIPVEQSHKGCDARRQQRVDQSIVKIDSSRTSF